MCSTFQDLPKAFLTLQACATSPGRQMMDVHSLWIININKSLNRHSSSVQEESSRIRSWSTCSEWKGKYGYSSARKATLADLIIFNFAWGLFSWWFVPVGSQERVCARCLAAVTEGNSNLESLKGQTRKAAGGNILLVTRDWEREAIFQPESAQN